MGANIWEQAKQVCCDSSLTFKSLIHVFEFEGLVSGRDRFVLKEKVCFMSGNRDASNYKHKHQYDSS